MNVSVSRLRSRLGITLAVLALLAAALLLLSHSATPAPADQNPNNTACKGHTQKGKGDPADPDSGVLQYTFACDGVITGYSILPDKQATGYDTEVFGADLTTKQIVAADAFSCSGDIPGFGVNCTGATSKAWDFVQANLTVDGDVCAEPRVDPLLMVTYASITSKGTVQQYIAGPFDLGRPRGCPKSSRAGKTRIPISDDVAAPTAPGT